MYAIIKNFFIQHYIIISILFGFYLVNAISCELFHFVVESFGIAIGLVIIIISCHSRKFHLHDDQFGLLGIGYIFISLFNFLHMIMVKEFQFFEVYSHNSFIQFYLVARFLKVLTFIFFVNIYPSKPNMKLACFVYTSFSILILLSILYWTNFPAAFIEGYGVTDFKVVSEMAICVGLIITSILLIKKRDKFHEKTFKYLLYCLIYLFLSSILLVSIEEVGEISHVIGHLFQTLSVYCIYKAIVEVNLMVPLQALYQSREKYFNLVQLLPEAIFLHVEEKIILANPAGLDILGLTNQDEIYEKSLWDYVDLNFLSDYKTTGCKDQEAVLIQENGETVDVMVTTTPYNDESILIILQNISEYKKAERMRLDLELQQEKLKTSLEYEDLKTSFYINISHEFKTPVNIILGVIQLLQEEDDIPEEWSKNLNIVKQNSYRLWRLMDNLIDISKISAGTYETTMVRSNVVQLVEDIVLSVAEYIKNNSKHNLTFTFDTDVEERVTTFDPKLIERILLNLFSNSIKFSKDNGHILVNIEDGEGHITIIVEDDGIGIPENRIDSIFNSFHKVDDSFTRKCEGSGIGLCIVYEFVKLHGGSIDVSSKRNYGSKFIIKLPADILDEQNHNDTQALSIYPERISIEFSDIYSLGFDY